MVNQNIENAIKALTLNNNDAVALKEIDQYLSNELKALREKISDVDEKLNKLLFNN